MERPAIYAERAELYDLIYRFKDYGLDAERVRHVLRAEGIADGARVLEAACGTGSYLVHLAHWYEASGFDASREVLVLARRKVPRVPLFQGDMAAFSIRRPVDALLCLFSSIGYLDSAARLGEAFACFRGAVRPGGVVVVEPWLDPQTYVAGTAHMNTYDGPGLKLCRMTVSRVDGDMSAMEMHWMVARDGGTVESFVDRHRLRMTPVDEMRALLEGSGFTVRHEPRGLMPGRGLFVGRRA